MAKEILQRRVVEEKKPVTVKLPVSALAVLDAYADWTFYERADVLEALIKTLLESKEFSAYFHSGPAFGTNGKGK